MYDSYGAILALCGITQNSGNPWFSAMWTLGARTEQDIAGHSTPKTLKIVGKSNDSASWVHGSLDGRPLASRGRRWILQGEHAKTIGKTMVFRLRVTFARDPWSPLVRAGQSRT